MHNFVVPPLPGFVTISGTVIDPTGSPVPGATVSASTDTVTNTPNTGYLSSTQTDANGMFRVVVMSGTNYTLIAERPPDPTSPFPIGGTALAEQVRLVFKR